MCDRVAERARRFAPARVFHELDQFLKADLDVVHVLLPPQHHAAAARRVLEAGRHVLIEKPMAPTAAECRELVALAQRRGLRVGVNHNFLFLPAYEKLRRAARDGTLGALDQLSASWLYPFAPLQSGPFDHWALAAPGNLFLELGVHLAAIAMDLVGPLDTLEASASAPLELPGARRAYRHWQARGTKGRTAVSLELSLGAGPAERAVRARGYAALARCDLERDLYACEEASGCGAFARFGSAARVLHQLGADAARNLLKSALGTLAQSPAASPFAESIGRSIGRFYETLGGEPEPRLDGAFGARVLEECERVVAASGVERTTAIASPSAASERHPRVLVVGGSGFIGRHLVRALAARGVGVRVATRNAAAARLALEGVPVEIVEGEPAVDGIEVVYDLSRPTGSRWEDYERHVAATRRFAERVLEARVKRFIYTGTIDAHYAGDPAQVITSDTPLDPQIHRRNFYARCKAACEAELGALYRARGLPLVILRPGIVIGPGAPPAHWGVGRYSSATRTELWGEGRHPLPFVLVEDVVAALVLALDKPGIEGRAFLLTDAPLLSARNYVEAVSAASGTRLRAAAKPIWSFYLAELLQEAAKHLVKHPNRRVPSYRDWDSRTHRARYDSSAARELLGWRPAGTREALIERGIVPAVREALR